MTSSTPFWQVIGVFDPDRRATDFSYTVGLAARGLPELHLWARPSHGTDPGADWEFSANDRGRILNEFAAGLVAATLTVGERVTRTYDGGTATVTFTLERPVEREELDAFQTDPDARVIPVRWTLERLPEGPLTPVAAESVPALQDAWAALALADHADRAVPTDWLPDSDVLTFDPAQRYGPLTGLVLAQAAEVARADLDALADFLPVAMSAEQALGASHVITLSLAAARPVGRTAALQQLLTDTGTLVDHLVGAGPDAPRLAELVTAVTGDPQEDANELRHAVRRLLHHAVAALLLTQAVRDVIDPTVRRAGLGPWSWSRTGTVPNTDWLAPAADLDAARELFGSLSGTELTQLARAHSTALSGVDDEPYPRLVSWLRARQVTSAAATPAVADLLDFADGARVQDRAGLGSELLDALDDAVGILTTARVHADDLGAAGQQTLVEVLGGVLPDLEQWLDPAVTRHG